jgi:intraflagellar transport protein 140
VPESTVRKSRPASALSWHPSRKVLVVGWETGELTAWSDQDKIDIPALHKAEITVLQWSSQGSRLLTADAVRKYLLIKFNTSRSIIGTKIFSFE